MKNKLGSAILCKTGVWLLALVALVSVSLTLGSVTALADESIVPTDLPALKAHVGQVVEVKGTVASVGKSPTGNIIFVNFDKKAHNALVVVFFTSGSKAGSVKSPDELQAVVGKEVIVKGELTAFKDDVQMTLQSVDDLKVTP